MRLGTILRSLGITVDRGTWLDDGRILACAYPRRAAALAALGDRGVTVLINLHERPHDPHRLRRFGMTELHLPVRDFAPPSPDQLASGVAAIRRAVANGAPVAVHCGGGLGRTGTLLACWLVAGGASADNAIARVRAVRPGSVETADQVGAVEAFARRRSS
jgi:atypical dual specificity phosphatase